MVSEIWTEKYRPGKFSELVGQEEIIKRVSSLVNSMNVPHLMFAGPAGTGKSTLLECLRYALDCPPKGKQAQKLHQEIIKENLGRSAGRVELTVVSSAQNGKQYTITDMKLKAYVR